jgi:fermentation-respiration switch protein FrsA (DUF1100 family)
MADFLEQGAGMARGGSLAIVAGLLFLTADVSAQSSERWLSWRPGQVLENSLLFHPASHTESWQSPPAWLEVQDVWLQSREGHRIHAWWFPRPEAPGAILFCHGNAGNLSHRSHMVAALMQSLGESVLIFDYPGYGRSDGRPNETGCYAAADAAYDWLTQANGIPGERILLFGESLGGGVATDLASRCPHHALVLVKTYASIPDMARQHWFTWASSGLVQNRFDSLAKISRCSGPVYIAHGDKDRLIPLSQAKKLYEAATEPKRFFLLRGSDHNDPIPPELFDSLEEFLTKN